MLDDPLGLPAQGDVVKGGPDLASLAAHEWQPMQPFCWNRRLPWAALGMTFIEA
jgi:hypothetical protein